MTQILGWSELSPVARLFLEEHNTILDTASQLQLFCHWREWTSYYTGYAKDHNSCVHEIQHPCDPIESHCLWSMINTRSLHTALLHCLPLILQLCRFSAPSAWYYHLLSLLKNIWIFKTFFHYISSIHPSSSSYLPVNFSLLFLFQTTRPDTLPWPDG